MFIVVNDRSIHSLFMYADRLFPCLSGINQKSLGNIPILPIGIVDCCNQKLTAPPFGPMNHLVYYKVLVHCTMSRFIVQCLGAFTQCQDHETCTNLKRPPLIQEGPK